MILDIKKLWSTFNRKRKKQISLLIVLTVLASFSEVLSIGAIFPFLSILIDPDYIYNSTVALQMLDFFNINQKANLLFLLTAAFSIAVLISGLLRLALLYAQAKLSFAIGADISNNLFNNILLQSYEEHTLRNSSEVIAEVTQKSNEMTHLIVLPIMTVVSSFLLMLFIVLALVLLSPLISIPMFLTVGIIYLLITLLIKEKINRNSNIISKYQGKLIKILQESLSSIRDVLISGNISTYLDQYRITDKSLRRARSDIQIISGTPKFLIESLGMILIAVCAYIFTIDNGSDNSIVPVLGTLALGIQKVLPAFQQLYTSATYVRAGQSQLSDVLKVLFKDKEKNKKFSKIGSVPFSDCILLDKVSFNYKVNNVLALNEVQISINKGDCIGVIGKTGSGKISLIDVISGLILPSKGVMSVDGVKINGINSNLWQKNISYVPQSIYLLDATVFENIAFGIDKNKIDHDLVIKSAIKAEIHSKIDSLEDQYNTVIGENGVSLSGGQRQRIGIARALYRNSNLIILDEATSALDIHTESSVMRSIIDHNKTIIIVAHRLTTLKDCNKIYEMDQGSIISVGSYDKIINSK